MARAGAQRHGGTVAPGLSGPPSPLKGGVRE